MARNKDNAQGAPTEGLGQNVTFAFQPGSAVPQQSAGDAAMLRGGVKGGDGQIRPTGAPRFAPEEDPLLDLLNQFATAAIKQNVGRARKEAYLKGMQRAAAGEGIKEIEAELPWYATLFGEADVVEGARQYEANTRAAETVARMEMDMPELRKLGMDQAREEFARRMEESMTGDAAADIAISQQYQRLLPALMKGHAKEHYGWQQEVATENEARAFQANVRLVQATAKRLAKGDRTSDSARKEWEVSVLGLLRSMQPVEGRDDENYKESMTANIRAAARRGDFFAVNAIKDSGFFDDLNPDQQRLIEADMLQGENTQRSKFMTQENIDLKARIEALATLPPEGFTTAKLAEHIEALNGKYIMETGSRQGVFTPEEQTSLLSRNAVAIQREKDRQLEILKDNADRAAKAAAADRENEAKRLAAEAAKAARDQSIWETMPTIGVHITANTIEKAEVDAVATVMAQRQDQIGDRLGFAYVLNRHYEGVGKPLEGYQRQYQQLLDGMLADPSKLKDNQASIEDLVGRMKLLRAHSPNLAVAYFGERGAKVLHRYEEIRRMNPTATAEMALQLAADVKPTIKIDADVEKALTQYVTGEQPGVIGRVFGGTPLTPSSLAIAARAAAPYAQHNKDLGLGAETAASQGYTEAVRKGELEVVGPWAIAKMPVPPGGRKQPVVADFLNLPDRKDPRREGHEAVPKGKEAEAVQEHIEMLIDQQVLQPGYFFKDGPKDVVLHQSGETLYATVVDSNDNLLLIQTSLMDIAAGYTLRRKYEREHPGTFSKQNPHSAAFAERIKATGNIYRDTLGN